MALIVITVVDSPEGAQVGVVSEPAFDTGQSAREVTPAQLAALSMLKALESEIRQDRGLIQLIN